MPQGSELHVLVAQSFSATKECRITNKNNSKSAYNEAGQRALRRAEMGFSVEIRVFGVQVQFLLVR